MNAFGLTNSGVVRKENQDCFRIDLDEKADVAVCVLCDGMGGAQAGSIASNLAADAFMSHAANTVDTTSTAKDLKNILNEAVNYANIKVYDKSFSDFACLGMGCTLVSVVITPKRVAVANVGDSRAYLISDNKIIQISKDHSYVEKLIDSGMLTRAEAGTHPKRNIITKAIGVEASIKCDLFEPKVKAGDRVILCSDGLSNLVTNDELLSCSSKNSNLEKLCEALVDLALERGAPDNVSVVIVQR